MRNLRNLVRRFFESEGGFGTSAELILMGTIVCIGIIAGLTTFRDQLVQELADAADAVSRLDQSYSYSGITIAGVGTVAGSTFSDAANAGGSGASCLSLTAPATGE